MQRSDGRRTTADKFQVPTHSLSVVGLDNSEAMIAVAVEKLRALALRGKQDRSCAIFLPGDMHNISILEDEHGPAMKFSGVWSCAALFTHTPLSLLEQSIRSVSAHLKQGSIFFASYTNGKASGRYDKLIASSTGRLKYFSHPDPAEIESLAAKHGLNLIRQSYSDYTSGGRMITKRLFASQLFEKS
jgi:SAM-dependent methyltransferase